MRPAVETTLMRLQQAVRVNRRGAEGEEPLSGSFTVPGDSKDAHPSRVHLTASQLRLRAGAEDELRADLRFEYIKDKDRERLIKQFIVQALADKDTNHVPQFRRTHAHEIMYRACYLPVIGLQLGDVTSLGEATIYPADDPRVSGFVRLGDRGPYDSVISIPSAGTNPERMMLRARPEAERALRALRLALLRRAPLTDAQLRFHLGETYAFDERLSGWAADDAITTPLTAEIWKRILNENALKLADEPRNDAEEQASIALRWIDAAHFSSDQTVGILFRFFALEALLGDSSEGLKAPDIAFMRTALGQAVNGHFPSPMLIYDLYDEVRSKAVHGGPVLLVSGREVDRFTSNVISCMDEYLKFCEQHGITTQPEVRRRLCAHEDAGKVLAWLQDRDIKKWGNYVIPSETGDAKDAK